MLQYIRDRAQSWIAVLIVGMLILGLASFAWDAYFSPDPEVPVAKVDGEKVTANQFQQEYQRQRARLQSMIGGADLSQLIPDETQFKMNVLKQMEEELLIRQRALDAGFRVSDELLAQQIRGFEAFQTNGEFDQSLYQQWLSQNSMSPGAFEEMLRHDVLVQQYRYGIMATTWSSAQERDAILKVQEQQRDIGYINIPASDYLSKISVSDDDAKTYYDENSHRYTTQEQVSIAYIELSTAELGKDVHVEEKALRELYTDRQLEFGTPEERRTRHILLEVDAEAGENAEAEAKQKAEELVKKIRNGESFAALAKEHSDDFGSASEGGELGFLGRDAMLDPAFADAAFALKKGEVSDPVRSTYGYHIIKLEEIKPGKMKSFAEVRQELEQDYRQHQAEDAFFEQSEILANLTFENPDTLTPAAEALGLKIKTTPMFTRDFGPGIATEAKIRSAAFSDEVLIHRNNSEVLELGGDRVIVLRVKEHHESSVRPFEDVKNSIVAQIKKERAEEKAKAEGQELLKAMAGKKDIAAFAKEKKLAWNHPGLIKRSDKAVNQDILKEAFRVSRSGDDAVTLSSTALASGDYAVIAVFDVKDADAKAQDEAKKQSVVDQRERYYGMSELTGALDDMRRGASVHEYPENL